jgi:hypothetical protein
MERLAARALPSVMLALRRLIWIGVAMACLWLWGWGEYGAADPSDPILFIGMIDMLHI